jgi:glutathione reductase (NADPH)
MATRRFDVVVIGGGNAGMGVTVPTRRAGRSVAVLEPGTFGGTCSNRGCTPKKLLVAAAHTLDEIARADAHHIKVGRARLDWAAMIRRKADLIRPLPERLAGAVRDRGAEIIAASGRFVAANAVAAGDDVLEAGHVVVATGSKPRPLPFPGADLMITSDEVLTEEEQPRAVVFVGGGVIAFEFAHVYVRAGTKVTILQDGPQFLGKFDQDMIAEVLLASRRIGIDARADVTVKRIEPAGGRLRVVYVEDGRERAITVDRVIHGAGRVANLDGLDLAAGGVAVERDRIVTDRHLRSTSNGAVFACGDALAGKAQLSPLATYEGQMVGRNLLGASEVPDYDSIPSCLFTVPGLAMVGLTEAAARQAGLDMRVEVNDMRDWLSGKTWAETSALAKVIVDRGSDLIRGAHIVGHGGEELIHLFALAMRHRITTAALKEAVYAFPTFTADMRYVM